MACQRLEQFNRQMSTSMSLPNIPPGVAPWMNQNQIPQMQPQPMTPWLVNHGYGQQPTPQFSGGFMPQNSLAGEGENNYTCHHFPEAGYFVTLVLFTESRDEESMESVPLTALCKALYTIHVKLGKNPQQRYTLSDVEMEYRNDEKVYTKEYTFVSFENIPLAIVPYLKEAFEEELKQLVHGEIFEKITSRNYLNSGFHLNSFNPRNQGSKMSIDCTIDGMDWNPQIVRTVNGAFFQQSDHFKWSVMNSNETVDKEAEAPTQVKEEVNKN